LADRLQIPVLTLIDEPHDAGTASAEQEALGPAVAETLIAVAGLRVPVTSLVVGRAAGVGAIALANRGQTWMVPGRTVEIAVRDDDVVGVLSLSAAHLKSTGYASGVVA
jgi:acetyl-CoA carboxylase alpha subunit